MSPFGVVIGTVRVSPAARGAGWAVGQVPSPTTDVVVAAGAVGLAAGEPNGVPRANTAATSATAPTPSRISTVFERGGGPPPGRPPRAIVFGRTPVARLAARLAARVPS